MPWKELDPPTTSWGREEAIYELVGKLADAVEGRDPRESLPEILARAHTLTAASQPEPLLTRRAAEDLLTLSNLMVPLFRSLSDRTASF